MDNRERALQVFAVASLLEARGANPYRVRAYRRAAVRLLGLPEDAPAYLDERGELDLPGLGTRLRRKLGELARTEHLSFHDELLAAEPRPIRTLMTVPGIGPRTAQRLVDERKVRGLKSLARAARRGRLRTLRGIGSLSEQRWADAAETLLGIGMTTATTDQPPADRAPSADRTPDGVGLGGATARSTVARAGAVAGDAGVQLPLALVGDAVQTTPGPGATGVATGPAGSGASGGVEVAATLPVTTDDADALAADSPAAISPVTTTALDVAPSDIAPAVASPAVAEQRATTRAA